MLAQIPNLRKISMNYQIKPERAAHHVQNKYVMSYKPNPAVFAFDNWHPEDARRELRGMLEHGHGCHVELIMKDISTVRYHPERLWEWSEIAMQVAHEFAT
jgi:hypothetical protein